MEINRDVVIIGAGIAGISAAIYLKRANKNVLLIEKKIVGGQIANTSVIENYPGVEKMDGASFSVKLYKQIKEFEIDYLNEEVLDIKNQIDYKEVILNDKIITTKTVIIATGRKPKKLGLINEDDFVGKGISYCATCDGNFYRDKVVAVVGGGNSALESALYLAALANKVYIVNRTDEIRGDKSLLDAALEKDNIIILKSSIIDSIDGTNKLEHMIINNKAYDIDGLFINIGLTPYITFSDLKIDNGYIIVNDDMETNIKGIYACGDIIKKNLYQIVTAASEGAIAGTSAIKAINISNRK